VFNFLFVLVLKVREKKRKLKKKDICDLFSYFYFFTCSGSIIGSDGNVLRCTFPRILAGVDGLVNCFHFDVLYPCPYNSGSQVQRESVCDRSFCEDCISGDDFVAGAGVFKCLKDGRYCGLPEVFLYDNVPDCLYGEDLCFLDHR